MKSKPYNLAKLELVRKLILETVCFDFYGLVMEGDTFLSFVQSLHRAVCPKGPQGTILDSARNLAGKELTEAAAKELAWRVAGNLDLLREGRAVSPWSGQSEWEWVPLEFVHVSRKRRVFKARKPEDAAKAGPDGLVKQYGVFVVAKILAGLSAGLFYKRFWSSEYCHIIKTAAGFSKRNRAKYSRVAPKVREWTYLDPRDFFGMRLYGLVNPEKSRPGEVYMEELKATHPGVSWNRGLLLLRSREDYACPLNYDPDRMDCFECHAGTDVCKAACHRVSFVKITCPRCHRQGVYHDPESESDWCVDCAEFHV